MASGAWGPPEWHGDVRLAGAPGETGVRGADSGEPHTWWAVESQLRLSPRNFLGHLGWRSQRRRLRTGRRGEVPAAGSRGSQDASTYCGAGPGEGGRDWGHRLSGVHYKPPVAWHAVSTVGYRGASRVSQGKGTPKCAGGLRLTLGRSGHRASVSPK